jgi:hypothetical protein
MAQLQRFITQYIVFYCVTAIVWVRKSFVDTHAHGMVLVCREKIMFLAPSQQTPAKVRLNFESLAATAKQT